MLFGPSRRELLDKIQALADRIAQLENVPTVSRTGYQSHVSTAVLLAAVASEYEWKIGTPTIFVKKKQPE